MSTDKVGQHSLGKLKDREIMQISYQHQLQSSHLIKQRSSKTDEIDACASAHKNSFSYRSIGSTVVSIMMRTIGLFFNMRLAFAFYQRGDTNYFVWTVICVALPLLITSMIYCYMCYVDGKFKKGFAGRLNTLCSDLITFIFLRDYNTLVYLIRCKCAESRGDTQLQLHYYKMTMREESDVAFIRLFDCFLESAPQKILQISIVLRQEYEISYLQAIVICLHFGSMAWCLAVYHRNLRYAQADKYNIKLEGFICQLCWHFCISVSRTLCIAFIVSLFPFWTILGCSSHALLCGALIFAYDRPKMPAGVIANLFLCFILGIIYIFTYISTRDESTKKKYILYYTTCFLENMCCVALFAYFATPEMKSSAIVFCLLCSSAIVFYFSGIAIMIAYYSYFHPRITARTSKRALVNNN